MISAHTIQKIFDVASVEDVIGEVVPLKKAGANLRGPCPFHQEKTPSFTVSPAKGIYKCFGCGKAGNVVNFVMEFEQLNYVEALRRLAARYNIEVEEEGRDIQGNQEAREERESVSVALEFAARYFQDQLSTPEGKVAGYGYLLNRGLHEDIIHRFQLGYSQDAYDGLLKEAGKQGFKNEILLKAGLIKEKTGVTPVSYYDAFRDRVMFPVHGLTGKVLGFGGRRLGEGKGPKYLNSAETEFYHKSEILYGIFQAKKAIREKDTCWLTEGYLDVIMLHQHGIEHVVASSGTALTEGQVKVIRRFTENVTVLFDADPAGIKASTRSINIILALGMNVNIALLPEGEDPDSMCRKVGGEEFREYVRIHSVNFVIFKAQSYSEQARKDPILKTKAIREILESIVLIPDPLKRSAFIKECAVILDADEKLLQSEAGKMRRQVQDKEVHEVDIPELAEIPTGPQGPSQMDQEMSLLKNLIRYGKYTYRNNEEGVSESVAEFVVNEIYSDEIELESELVSRVFSQLQEMINHREIPDDDFFIQDPELAPLAAEALSEKYILSPVWASSYEIITLEESENFKKEIDENLNHLKLRHLSKLIDNNIEQIKNAKEEELTQFLQIQQHLLFIRQKFAHQSGIVVLRM